MLHSFAFRNEMNNSNQTWGEPETGATHTQHSALWYTLQQLETADLPQKNICSVHAMQKAASNSCQQQCERQWEQRGMGNKWRALKYNLNSRRRSIHKCTTELMSTCERVYAAQPTDGIRSLLKNSRTYVSTRTYIKGGREKEEEGERNTHTPTYFCSSLCDVRVYFSFILFCSHSTVHISIVIIRKTIYKFYIICTANISTAK